MARLIKRNVSFSLIILFALFYVLPPESFAAPKNADSTTQPVITQQNSKSDNQGSNNRDTVPGQEKVKENKDQNIGNNGKNDETNNGNDNQGSNDRDTVPGQEKAKENKDQNTVNNNKKEKTNNGSDNQGNVTNNGNGEKNGNDKIGNDLNESANNGLGESIVTKTNSFFEAIGRGTNKVAGVLKAIPAKAVPTAVAAAQALGANLADMLEALAQYVKGIIGIVNPVASSQGAGATVP